MGLHKIKRGLDLPLVGEPEQTIDEAPQPATVALLGEDYVGMKPTLHVAVGDTVRRGQLLFGDKKMPGVRFTAPASGTVASIHRGAKRVFRSLIINVDPEEQGGSGAAISFSSYSGRSPDALSESEVRELLLESGLWTAMRARPYGRVADPAQRPHSIFVTAMDSNVHAPDLDVVLDGQEERFHQGLRALGHLTDGEVFVCVAPGSKITIPNEDRMRREEFAGPHPSGTVGLHIHTLDPVDRKKLVWYLGAQDVVAMGHLFATGELDVRRVVALGGPKVVRPRLLRTRLGAAVDALVKGELADGENRVLAGSVLSGRMAGEEDVAYIGRYHQQISVLAEGRERVCLGWFLPGSDTFSVSNTFLSKILPGKRFSMTTTTHGSHRAIVPIGHYEKVMAFDILPSYLLKSLVMHDLEQAEELGCLELEEEDVALLSFVCPGKNDYGISLREVLTQIEKEG